jgi:DnaK suppressor protein
MKTGNLERLRKLLETELRVTLSRLPEAGDPLDPQGMPRIAGDAVLDPLEAARTREIRDVGFATRERLTRRAQQLRAALVRLAEGIYGVCVRCGHQIGAARLRAIPEVATCIGCQDAIDRMGVQEAAESEETG